MHESIEFQILSGIRIDDRNMFWGIFILILVLTLSFTLCSITLKKMFEKFKDYKIQKRVHVNIGHIVRPAATISMIQFLGEENQSQPPIPQLNNIKYNDPILTGIQMAFFGSFSLARILVIAVLQKISDDVILVPYKIFMLRKVTFSIFYCLILPIIYLAGRKDVRQFILLKIKPIFF